MVKFRKLNGVQKERGMYLSSELHKKISNLADSVLPVRIEGTGCYHPKRLVTSAEIDRRLGWRDGQTESRFRIRARGVAEGPETSSFMAAAAAQQALDAAGIAADQVDLVLAACGVGEQPIPATATLVHHRLGLTETGIPAYDIGATCLSFVAAMDHASLKIAAGQARRVLIVSADIASVGLDWTQPEAAAIFGDGAAAVVLGKAEDRTELGTKAGLLALRMETWSEGRDACVLAAGGTRVNPACGGGIAPNEALFHMDGQAAFRVAARRLPRFLARLMASAGVSRDEIGVVIPHQASAQALDHARALIGFGKVQVVDIFADHGNQIATSIPTALHHAVTSQRLPAGTLALLIGTSAGISIGGALLRT